MAAYEVQRTATVPADPATVHAMIDDFHAWTAWSPWEDVDPALHRTYDGAESGVGARYAWSGNRKAGTGTMRITASTPERIDLVVEFERPFRSTSPTTFDLRPVDGGTQVTWTMTGEQHGFAAIFGRIVPMDRLIGGDFERGLARMAAAAKA
jgi:hypothetical protein